MKKHIVVDLFLEYYALTGFSVKKLKFSLYNPKKSGALAKYDKYGDLVLELTHDVNKTTPFDHVKQNVYLHLKPYIDNKKADFSKKIDTLYLYGDFSTMYGYERVIKVNNYECYKLNGDQVDNSLHNFITKVLLPDITPYADQLDVKLGLINDFSTITNKQNGIKFLEAMFRLHQR